MSSAEQPDQLARLLLDGAGRERLAPILDACVAVYAGQRDEDEQADFKGKAKTFLRTYGFLSSILEQCSDNPAFKKWLADAVFSVACTPDAAA